MKSNSGKVSKIKFAVFIIAAVVATVVRFSASADAMEGANHAKIWLGVSFITGIGGTLIYRKNFAVSGLIVSAGFATAVVLRIFYDLVFTDSTSHNLFPIEIVIWSIMAFIPAIAGAFLCIMILRMIKKGNTENHSAKNKN